MKSLKRSFSRLLQGIASMPIHFFVITSVVGGLVLIVLVPPFQIPDEFVHFTRSYEVSEFKSADRFHYKQIDYKGSKLPDSIFLTLKATRLHLAPAQPDVPVAKKYDPSQSADALKIPLNKSKVSFYDTGAQPAYFPLLYLPQAIVIKILSLVNSPVIVMLYATRIVGLLVWVYLCVLALKILSPSKLKLAMAGVLVLPMFIAQSSASTDPLLNGLTVLFLALISKSIHEKRVPSNKLAAILVAILFVMVMAKPIYIAFGLLFLALPTKLKGAKGFVYKTAGVAIPLVLYLLWSAITKDNGPPVYIESVAIGHAQPSVQAHYLIPNMLNFLQPLVNTLFLGWGDGVYGSVIGNFGKLDTPLPLVFVVIGYTLVLVAAFAKTDDKAGIKDSKAASKYLTPLTVLAGAAFAAGVYLAMYVYSTPPGSRIITGVQGRYFLPLLPLLVLFASKSWLTIKKSAYVATLVVLPAILLVASVAMIFLRYYATYP